MVFGAGDIAPDLTLRDANNQDVGRHRTQSAVPQVRDRDEYLRALADFPM